MEERIDTAVAALAARQHGVVSWDQLIALGLSRQAIEWRVAAGHLHRLHVGVYAVGHTALTASGRRLAAVLACGPGALLSHEAAADHWGFRPSASPRIHVVVPTTNGRGVSGVVVHRTRRLRPFDVAVHDGIPVTSVGRTLLDLTRRHDTATLRKAIERAERLRIFDRREIEAIPGRPWRRLLSALDQADPAPFRSDLESDFLALCRAAGLPAPEVNARVCDLEVDFLWRDQRVVVEVDGWAYHRSRRAFGEDRRRDVALTAEGLTVLRFADDDVGEDAVATVGRLLRVER